MTSKSKNGTALITGASTGIGAVYADRLAKRGYDLVLAARDLARMQELAARLRLKAGVAVEVLQADLITTAGRDAVEQLLIRDSSVTLLVNNAGMGANGSLAEMDPAKIETLIELNVIAVARLACVAARQFSSRGQGTIINIASVLALVPELFNGVYNATKAFVLSLTQSMQHELAGSGVRVQAVLPGATRTEIWARSGSDLVARAPSMVMEADEMVDAALAGLDAGEAVTIPSLPNAADWDAFLGARRALGPNLSKDHAAARYKIAIEAVR
jgi:short-subunit dehydrogenase